MLFTVLAILVAQPALSGQMKPAEVKVLTGSSLQIAGSKVEISGVDAPDFIQGCYDGQGRFYRCGAVAMERLKNLAEVADFRCRPVSEHAEVRGQSRVTCFSNGKDVGATMVAEGLAVATNRTYANKERQAQVARSGMWGGKFIRPDRWRTTRVAPVASAGKQ